MDNHPTLFELPEIHFEKPICYGIPRLKVAERTQVEFRIASLDELIPQDHLARLVWGYVNQLDMSILLGNIQAVEGNVGRPATDPKILLALWLYATLEGIVSARVIAEYCQEHIAYQWICGNVKTNHHTLSDFATKHGESFDAFLTQSVAILLKQGVIDLKEVSQDGMKVRANAGSASFRKETKLQEYYEKAEKHLKQLREELKMDLSGGRSKKKAAAARAVEEREKKIKQALEELNQLREEKKKDSHKSAKELAEILENTRASTTDPEARKMKMANGGFHPAYNIQFVTTKKGKAIVELDVRKNGNDNGLLVPIMKKFHNRFGKLTDRWLVDAGYVNLDDLTEASRLYKDCVIYMPPRTPTSSKRDPYEKAEGDTSEVIAWRERMKEDKAREIYKARSSTAEFSNAQSRNKGLQQLLVRGLEKVRATVCRFALVHNMQRFFSLRTKMA
jgi:transposase